MEIQTQLPPSSTNDTPIDASILELAPEEQRILDAAKAEVEAAKASAAPTPAPSPAPAADAPDPAPAQDANPTDQNASDPNLKAPSAKVDDDLPDVTLTGPTSGPVTLPVPTLVKGDAPKFDEHISELATRRDANDKAYDDQTIDVAEYRKRDREIQRQEHEIIAAKAAYETQLRTQQAFVEQANKAAADAWTASYEEFVSAPRNRGLFETTLHFHAFQGAINAVEDQVEKAKGSPLLNHELLERARKVYLAVMGMADPAATPASTPAAPPPAPVRKGPAEPIPQTLSATPAAAPAISDDSSIDSIVGKDINDIEMLMAGMPRAELDKLLRKLPGATTSGTLNE